MAMWKYLQKKEMQNNKTPDSKYWNPNYLIGNTPMEFKWLVWLDSRQQEGGMAIWMNWYILTSHHGKVVLFLHKTQISYIALACRDLLHWSLHTTCQIITKKIVRFIASMLCGGIIQWLPVDSPHTGPVIRSFDVSCWLEQVVEQSVELVVT